MALFIFVRCQAKIKTLVQYICNNYAILIWVKQHNTKHIMGVGSNKATTLNKIDHPGSRWCQEAYLFNLNI